MRIAEKLIYFRERRAAFNITVITVPLDASVIGCEAYSYHVLLFAAGAFRGPHVSHIANSCNP